MKNIYTIIKIMALCAGAIVLAACPTLFDDSPAKRGSSAPAGMGTVYLHINNANARTLQPPAVHNFDYEVEFVDTNDSENIRKASLTRNGEGTIHLEYFVHWKGTLYALLSDTETRVGKADLGAEFTLNESVTEKIFDGEYHIMPFGTDTGTFSYRITFPAGLTDAELYIEGQETIDFLSDGPIATDEKTLAPGMYTVRAVLANNNNVPPLRTGKVEVAHIYAGQTTELDWIFIEDSFFDIKEITASVAITAPAGQTLAGVTLENDLGIFNGTIGGSAPAYTVTFDGVTVPFKANELKDATLQMVTANTTLTVAVPDIAITNGAVEINAISLYALTVHISGEGGTVSVANSTFNTAPTILSSLDSPAIFVLLGNEAVIFTANPNAAYNVAFSNAITGTTNGPHDVTLQNDNPTVTVSFTIKTHALTKDSDIIGGDIFFYEDNAKNDSIGSGTELPVGKRVYIFADIDNSDHIAFISAKNIINDESFNDIHAEGEYWWFDMPNYPIAISSTFGITEWKEELDNSFTASASTTAFGILHYSFSPTSPIAASYKLYYIAGNITNVDTIIHNDSYKLLNDTSGTIGDFSGVYSFVVVAEYPGLPNINSNAVSNINFTWLKGLTDLQANASAATFGTFTYSFTATNPPANTYTLYYIEGENKTADEVKAGTSENAAALSGTISGLTKGKYSIVVEAEHTTLGSLFSLVEEVNIDWIAGPANFTATPHNTDFGTLAYSFTASNPPAAYTLYYVTGDQPNAAAIINAGNAIPLTEISGTVGDIGNFAGIHSFVVVAEHPELSPVHSNVVSNINFTWVTGPAGFTASAHTTEFGKLNYSFTASNPPAESYKLYYVTGNQTNANTIIDDGNYKPLTEIAETIGDFVGVHSFVIVAEYPGLDPVPSNVRNNINFNWITTTTQFNTNFTTSQNTTTFVDMNYSFTPTNPPADQYMLIYVPNSNTGATSAIKTNTNRVEIPLTETSGTIPLPAGNNRVTLVAKYNGLGDLDATARTVTINWITTANQFNTSFTTSQNTTTFVDMNYSFTPTTPPANEYILMYVPNSNAGATSAIKTNTNRVEIPLTETSGTIPLPAGNNRVTLVAKYNGLGDLDATARTVNIDWLQDLSAASRFTASPTAAPGVLSYSLTATNPPADSYTLYYLQTSGNETAQQIIDDPETNTLPITPGDDRTIDLEQGGKNRFVVVARYAGLNDTISRVQTADFDTIFVKTSIQESIINTVVSWSFENEAGTPFNPVGDITLTYTYSGLAIAGGTLTTNIISGNESITLASNVRQHTIIHNDLIEITDIVVSTIFGSEPVDSAPINSSNIELRLYNMAYAKASEYGAVEMFSHGRAAPVSLGPTTQARAHTIINYDSSGNPVNLYGATFSRGHGGLSGSADATNLREWHYDGEFLYGRSNGGNTNIVDGTDATGAVTPSTVADRWADRNSILAGHTTTIWAAFHNRFRQDPFNFIPYDINNGFDSLHEFMFTDPTTIGNNLTSGRSSAPEGLIRTTTNGALSHRNGMFQFSILMNGDRTGNRVNIQWSGDVTMTATGYAHSTITFFIDENFRFVKYHAFDRYTVTLLSATTSVQATMYFVYHENNIDLNNHATYRAHQIRPTHVNYCDCVNCDEFIAPNGNIADGSWVVANSRYPITLDWIENANAASKVSIPRP